MLSQTAEEAMPFPNCWKWHRLASTCPLPFRSTACQAMFRPGPREGSLPECGTHHVARCVSGTSMTDHERRPANNDNTQKEGVGNAKSVRTSGPIRLRNFRRRLRFPPLMMPEALQRPMVAERIQVTGKWALHGSPQSYPGELRRFTTVAHNFLDTYSGSPKSVKTRSSLADFDRVLRSMC